MPIFLQKSGEAVDGGGHKKSGEAVGGTKQSASPLPPTALPGLKYTPGLLCFFKKIDMSLSGNIDCKQILSPNR